MEEKKVYNQYMEDVISGDLISGKSIIKAVERHYKDLEKSKDDEYPYFFDEEWADKYISFIRLIRLQEGELNNHFFPIQPFQAVIIALTFGWRTKEEGLRRFNDTFFLMSKKNAKTTLMAAISIAEMYLEGEGGGQYLFAATTREQANICFNFAKLMVEDMIEDYRKVRNKTEVYRNSIIRNDLHCVMKSASQEAKSLEGKGSSVAVLDEYHIHKNDEVKDNIKTGMAGRRQPLFLKISTAGYNLTGPCKEYYDYCKQVLDGILESDRLLILIWEIDDDDDWKDEKVWQKANPNIGVSPRWDYLKEQFTEAVNLGGAAEVAFKIKHLNMWVNSQVTWISDEAWMKCYVPKEDWPEEVFESSLTLGLDLAATRDFSALGKLHYYQEKIWVDTDHYLPEEVIYKTMDAKLKDWQAKGFIKTTEGDTTDYDVIRDDIAPFISGGNLEYMMYDIFNSSQLVIEIQKLGFTDLAPLKMGRQYMSDPINEFEKLVLEGKLVHNGNPVLRWMLSNTMVSQERQKAKWLTKQGERKKIDGVISLLLALAAFMHIKHKIKRTPSIWKL